MSLDEKTIEQIPLLVQGKLSETEKNSILSQISNSPELQREYDFWSGVYSIRKELPRFEFSAHLAPEVLDRFAQGKVNQLSAEFSEISSHLQSCRACSEDVELLRQAVKLIPEEHVELKAADAKRGLASIFSTLFSPRVLAPVLSVLVLVAGVMFVMHKPGPQMPTVTVMLLPQFEKRGATPEGKITELEVSLTSGTKEVIFAFATDRVDVPNYHYSINLTPRSGRAISINENNLECRETKLSNQCQLRVDNIDALNSLKEGGSFSLRIREEFPSNVNLEPAEYEYFFKVNVK